MKNSPHRYTDERGIIQDLLETPIDAVTEITTYAGSVRGNHVHEKTVQWTYVMYGLLRVAWQDPDGTVHERMYGPHSLICEPAGVPHAWQAVNDTRVLVFTQGPRSGSAYESDTRRLETPILP